MTSGAPDHTIKIYLEKALGFTDKVPIYEIAPVSGRYYATPPTLTDEAFGPALLDSSGRLIVKAIPTTGGDTIDVNVTDRAARLLGVVYGSLGQKLLQKATTFELKTYDSFIETLLGGGLPAALDSLALKVREQGTPTVTVGTFPDNEPFNLNQVEGTAQTGADWTPLFQSIVKAATAPFVYNVTMTNADAEYNQALTANTVKFCIMTRDRSEFRFQYVTGKVATPTAPWITIAANEVYYEDLIKDASITLYFASASAGKIIEIIEWT